MIEFAFDTGFLGYTPSTDKPSYKGITTKEANIFNDVAITRDRITLTELNEMGRETNDIYLAIMNQLAKGEKAKRDIEEKKAKRKK